MSFVFVSFGIFDSQFWKNFCSVLRKISQFWKNLLSFEKILEISQEFTYKFTGLLMISVNIATNNAKLVQIWSIWHSRIARHKGNGNLYDLWTKFTKFSISTVWFTITVMTHVSLSLWIIRSSNHLKRIF